MTLHSAKGLEFPCVYMCGMEDGLFPSQRSMFSQEEIEEERRLCYVGITRAKQELFLTYAQRRSMYGGSTYSKASRFLDEIPTEYLNVIEKPKANKVAHASTTSQSEMFDKIFERKKESSAVKISEPVSFEFKAGDMVMHRKFGKGMILSVTPSGNDVKVEIMFDDVGTKALMGSFAKLKKAQ